MYDDYQFRIVFIRDSDCYVRILVLNAADSIKQFFPNPDIKQRDVCRRGQEYQVPDGIN